MSYQIKEIQNFGINLGEEQTLREKKDLYVNAEKIASAYNNALDALETSNTVGNIKLAENELVYVTKYNPSLDDINQRLESVRIELADIVDTVKDMQSQLEFDQSDFDRIDRRLDELKSLKKKYGNDEQEILDFLNEAKLKYDKLVESESMLKKLNKEKQIIIENLSRKADALSQARQDVAKMFINKVNEAFESLAMKNAKFDILFNKVDFSITGCDEIEFLFSANVGQPLKPLSEIISGGEMSRFMLAIKSIIGDKDNISTIVFDEIDTGISGSVGYEIACKMANISKAHQVIAVSHLPQISAMADSRYLISKNVVDNDTYTNIILLDEQGSINEVARLSGGDGNNESLVHAQKLIERCNQYKIGL